ncbi:MAG: alpha/beta hydrolase [Spirochaetae bacterium HGW-Spirochaetae-1]|jgi:pimeloyl-ACP methyl ester carboxylesterase|nr:MAG: alpha/beta hydrolase [Spirochaetae bacterium HGW-Spirochaetae-1]
MALIKGLKKLLFPLLATGLLFSACTSMGAKTIPMAELEKKYFYNNSKWIEVDGIKVHYIDEGSGPVLVLLHGVCASLHTWDGWAKELKGQYRIIRFDNMGFGLTGPSKNPRYEIDNYIRFLDKFTTVLNLKHFTIVGNSLGGYISWNYALAYPEKVDKMLLIDTVGYNQEVPGLMKLACFPIMRPIVRHIMPRYFLDKAVKEVYGDKTRITPELQARYFELAMREGNKNAWVDIFMVMKAQSKSKTLSLKIKDIAVPTMVMWGGKDEWVPVSQVENWKKDLPSARYAVFDKAGHVGMEEIPVETAREARLFFEGKESGMPK